MTWQRQVGIGLCGLAVALTPGGVSGQRQVAGILRGQVLDAMTLAPAPGVYVAPVGASQGTLTDAEGRFALELRATPGTRIRASQLGYFDLETGLDPNWASRPVTLVLRPDPVKLRGLTVLGERLAERRRGPYGVATVLDQEMLLEAPDGSAYELVRRIMPFATPCDPGGDELCMNGAGVGRGRSKISVCIDGQRWSGMGAQLEAVNPRGLYLVEAFTRVGEVRMYSRGYVERLIAAGTELPPISFGCMGDGVMGR